MQYAIWIAFLLGYPQPIVHPAPEPRLATPAVTIVKFEPCKTINRIGLRGIIEGTHDPVSRAAAPVESIEDGLSHVRTLSTAPIVAATEVNGWYFYANVVLPDENGVPSSFISGYAVKKGSREVIAWSVW